MYGAKTTPHMFVIDKEGKLVYQGAIDSKATAEHRRYRWRRELRESRARQLDGRQASQQREHEAIRLLG